MWADMCCGFPLCKLGFSRKKYSCQNGSITGTGTLLAWFCTGCWCRLNLCQIKMRLKEGGIVSEWNLKFNRCGSIKAAYVSMDHTAVATTAKPVWIETKNQYPMLNYQRGTLSWRKCWVKRSVLRERFYCALESSSRRIARASAVNSCALISILFTRIYSQQYPAQGTIYPSPPLKNKAVCRGIHSHSWA